MNKTSILIRTIVFCICLGCLGCTHGQNSKALTNQEIVVRLDRIEQYLQRAGIAETKLAVEQIPQDQIQTQKPVVMEYDEGLADSKIRAKAYYEQEKKSQALAEQNKNVSLSSQKQPVQTESQSKETFALSESQVQPKADGQTRTTAVESKIDRIEQSLAIPRTEGKSVEQRLEVIDRTLSDKGVLSSLNTNVSQGQSNNANIQADKPTKNLVIVDQLKQSEYNQNVQHQSKTVFQTESGSNKKIRNDKITYEQALNLIMSGSKQEGRKRMEVFIQNYPNSFYVANAYYWIGESFYGQGQFDQAILKFKDVVSKYPKHSKSSDSLYKLGMSYERLNDKSNAKFYYEMLIEDYPNTEVGRLAKKKVSSL